MHTFDDKGFSDLLISSHSSDVYLRGTYRAERRNIRQYRKNCIRFSAYVCTCIASLRVLVFMLAYYGNTVSLFLSQKEDKTQGTVKRKREHVLKETEFTV